MYQNNLFFLFLKSMYQNDLKTPENINMKQRKK